MAQAQEGGPTAVLHPAQDLPDGYAEGYRQGVIDGWDQGREEALADLSPIPPGTNLAELLEMIRLDNPIARRLLELLDR